MQQRSVPSPRPRGRLTFLSGLIAVVLAAATLQLAASPATAAPVAAAVPVASAVTATTCTVEFHPTVSSQGFVHPGVGLTAPVLENARTQIATGAEPWSSYYASMTQSSAASTTVSSSNASSADPTKPGTVAFNSQGVEGRFIADGLKAYTQTLMYVFTGSEVYRKNAMNIIRIWEQMDPSQYAYYTDAHIHTGIPMNRMVTAAEILRYSSCANEETPWTDADTAAFTKNLITPVIETFQHDNNYFMNQHTYPLMGAMAGYIFTDNAPRYAEAVEWFTVNATATDQGFNGSISRLFRMVTKDDSTGQAIADPHVQHVEMGRDQAHGGGDLTNAYYLARMMLAQGTKVDPTAGTISTAANAVGPYEFLDDRILSAADYFWQYMLGYDTPWTPVAYAISPDGTIRDTYNHISSGYRGRFNTASFWDLYYYYTYDRGLDLKTVAPHFYEAFTKRLPLTYYYGGSPQNAWDGVDGGGDFWLYMPAAAAGSSVPKKETSGTTLEVEDRYTDISGQVESGTDGTTGYVRLGATTAGSKIAFLEGSTASKTIGLRVRTDAPVDVRLTSGIDETVTIPDTGSQWRNVVVKLATGESIGDLIYLQANGTGGHVDIDSIDTAIASHSTPPVLPATVPSRLVGYTGASSVTAFAATDPGTGETLTYSAAGLPAGASLDSGTGALTWAPAAAGSADVVVSVDDGTTVAARHIELDSATSRDGALSLAKQGFDSNAIYESATSAAYTAAVADATTLSHHGSDADYLAAVQKVVAATAGLRLVSPRIADGSLNYPALLTSSTMGADVGKLDDSSNLTGSSYPQAVNLTHTFDFGPDFRVSASSFGLESNIFADRIAGSAVFGSNDATDWTRLTPGLTTMTQDFQTLAVSPDLAGQQFRYFRIKMLDPQPDVLHNTIVNLMELTEFHIFGDRHEIGNEVAQATISSPKAIAGKISSGDPVTVSVVTKAAVGAVSATIQGTKAAASSSDGVHWTVTAPVVATASGPVTLAIDETDARGTAGPTLYGTTDGSALFVGGDGSKLVDVANDAKVTASDKQWPGNGLSADQVGYLLFDGRADTAGDLNTATGSYYVIDFGAGAKISLDQVFLLPRATKATRANGTVVQASDDGTTWKDLTTALSGAAEGTWSDAGAVAAGGQSYRYLRLINQTAWSGDLAEVQLYGSLTYADGYFDTQVADTSTSTRASADEYDQKVAALRTQWNAPGADRTAVLKDLAAAKSILVPESSLFPAIAVARSQVVASSASWDGTANAADNGWRAFDGDPATATDTKTAAGWVQVDLGSGNARTVGSVRFLPRVGNFARMNGGVFQGSNDAATWDTLATVSGVSAVQWYDLPVASGIAYRYLRYFTSTGYANVAELQFKERVVDTTLLTERISAGETAADPEIWTAASIDSLNQAVASGKATLAGDSPTQAEVDTAAQGIADAIAGLQPLGTAWSAAQVYTKGDQVTYDGNNFIAQWWTRGQVPGASPWSAWAQVGQRTQCQAGWSRTWTASWQYNEGDIAVQAGHRWQAKWWTRNQTPGDANGPWTDLGTC